MRGSSGAGHRRYIEQESSSELFAEGHTKVAANVAGIDIEAVPEVFESVREDDPERRIGRADAADDAEVFAGIVARYDADRVGIARQQAGIVGPDDDARQGVLMVGL